MFNLTRAEPTSNWNVIRFLCLSILLAVCEVLFWAAPLPSSALIRLRFLYIPYSLAPWFFSISCVCWMCACVSVSVYYRVRSHIFPYGFRFDIYTHMLSLSCARCFLTATVYTEWKTEKASDIAKEKQKYESYTQSAFGLEYFHPFVSVRCMQTRHLHYQHTNTCAVCKACTKYCSQIRMQPLRQRTICSNFAL